ncbi:MAG: hypothetical protein EZS28_014029 [Streblomastix strix]|uniref:Uncharacterized protein n=1 Tax=Streblomastix strix TaxID=222440 RepID=A0A5J4W6Y1_9EUKA|nr:MAG: hypothetical protein EZS28_014029 [Streblomastix strix]
MRRIWTTAVIEIKDKNAYMGSTTRDIIINKDNELINESQITVLNTVVPTRGIRRKVDVNDGVIPVATAELSLISRQKETIRSSKPSSELKGALIDLTVATDQSMVYSIIVPTIEAELVRSSHRNGVHSIVIEQSTSEIFATCGYGDIRLWHLRSGNELVRIEEPNVECLCVCFIPSRTEVIS